ncbi:hypothetical protein C9374_000231 [Naegleria lovaniensis]|uniref:BRCT domain-containing protein n=1 Tax=Naegleria lovaniensis TaxID=51637 RepID=A0AA88GTV6_NAELO|nr:uncharacterized protein C9374_000231 [Naegleria lovaniensis]KAG2388792.1 hypothetical protein C9374_000231 [Naegleria lovaniensis]
MSKTLFSGLVFCMSGTLSKGRSEIEKIIKNHGGKVSSSITKATTHLITTQNEFDSPTGKVSKALEDPERVSIVNEDFLWDSISQSTVVPVKKYLFGNDDGDDEDDKDDEEEEEDNAQDDVNFEPKQKKRKLTQTTDVVEPLVKFENFSLLNDDLLFVIFKYLNVEELIRLCYVNSKFYSLISDESNEETVTFLINVRNNYLNSRVASMKPSKFFQTIHNCEYDEDDEDERRRRYMTPEEVEEESKKEKPVVQSLVKSQNRMTLSLEKWKTWKNKHVKAIKAYQTSHKNAKRSDYKYSLLESIKFRRFMDRFFDCDFIYARVSECDDDVDTDEPVDGQEEERTNTFKGGLKSQLRKILNHIEKFEEISFGRHEEEMYENYPKIYYEWIKTNAAKLQNIKSIYMMEVPQSDCEVSWLHHNDITEILNSLPKLSIWQSKGSIDLQLQPNISHVSLRSIILVSTGLSAPLLTNLFTAYLPNLHHLELFLGTSDQGGDFPPELLETTLLKKEETGIFPSLTYLGLRNYEHINKISKAIFESAVAKRVSTIDISLGNLYDKGVKSFIEILENGINTDFMCLEVLDVHRNYISKEMRARLLELPVVVNCVPSSDNYADDDNQEEENEDGDDYGDRYIALSE